MINFITSNFKYKKNFKKYSKFETKNMQPMIKIHWKKASGFMIIDKFNREYIDFTSGIFAANVGHKNKYLEKYVLNAIKTGVCHSYNYYNFFREKYLQKLIEFVGNKKLKKCFLVSSGTEATEAAFKFVRTHGISINSSKKGVICIKGNYHGRTMGSQMLSGKNQQSEWIGFFDKNIFHIDFPYPWKIKSSDPEEFFYNSLRKEFGNNFNFKNKISAIMLETFQGWGAIFYPKKYIKAIEKFCKKNKILLCFDEMQSGFGRTGKKFGFENYDVQPDLICCGKGMGSGFAIAGVIASKSVIDNPLVSGMCSTHSANPISCAAGLATIEIINKFKLVKRANNLGKYLHKNLRQIKHNSKSIIEETLGKGLIASIIFKNKNKLSGKDLADFVSQNCLDNGLLVCNTGRESIKLGPPLIISRKGIDKSLKIIQNAIKAAELL